MPGFKVLPSIQSPVSPKGHRITETSTYQERFQAEMAALKPGAYRKPGGSLGIKYGEEVPKSRRPLTPITETRPRSGGNLEIPDSALQKRYSLPDLVGVGKEKSDVGSQDCDFREEIDVGDFKPHELKMIVGRNRVRVIGEKNPQSDLEVYREMRKVLTIPPKIDPLSLKACIKEGKVVVSGRYGLKDRDWCLGKNGLLKVQKDGSTRLTLEVPSGCNPNKVHVQAVTKHYLVVTGPTTEGESEAGENKAEDFLETYELPLGNGLDLTGIQSNVTGRNTVIVEVPTLKVPRTPRHRANTK